jgi:hypothetical protein
VLLNSLENTMTAPIHGLPRPTVADAAPRLRELYGAEFPALWQGLLSKAGLTGRETDQASVQKLTQAMDASAEDPVRLLSRALHVRRIAHAGVTECERILSEHPQAARLTR